MKSKYACHFGYKISFCFLLVWGPCRKTQHAQCLIHVRGGVTERRRASRGFSAFVALAQQKNLWAFERLAKQQGLDCSIEMSGDKQGKKTYVRL